MIGHTKLEGGTISETGERPFGEGGWREAVTLAWSREYEPMLRQVARLAVPLIADYCVIDVLEEDGRLHRVGAAHVDPATQEILTQAAPYAPVPGSSSPALKVLATGESELVSRVTEEWLESVSQGPEHLELMRKLGPRSVMAVAVPVQDRASGVIWLASTSPDRRYGERDLRVAEQLGRTAGLALENAHLLELAREARGEAERRAEQETALREAIAAVSSAFTVEEIEERIAQGALEATRADGAFVERAEPAFGRSTVVAAAGTQVPAIGSSVPFEGSFSSFADGTSEPTVVDRILFVEGALPDEIRWRCPDCSAAAIPLADDGEPIGALVLLRWSDGSGFRPDEVARARSFGNLASLALHKIRLLEDSERCRDELQRVIESRARLVRGFSHDVKNPLGAADGYLQVLEMGARGELAPEQKEDVAHSRRSLRRAVSLIDDLLDLARAEAGAVELHLAPTDVGEAAREIVEDFRAQADRKGIRMTLESDSELPAVRSDPGRVRQVLANLVSNALKYTPPAGRVTVRVRVEAPPAGDPASRWISASVSDTGPGIPGEKQRLLFLEFSRLHPEEADGAGVGLAISRRIAEALGGDIAVDSTPGAGSTFTLRLPVNRTDPDG